MDDLCIIMRVTLLDDLANKDTEVEMPQAVPVSFSRLDLGQ